MPAFHYWFNGAAIFVAGGFLLSAVLGFIGVADQMKKRPITAIAAYVATLFLFAVGWWQAAEQGRDADRSQGALESVQSNEKELLATNKRMANDIGGLANAVNGLGKQMQDFVQTAILTASRGGHTTVSKPTPAAKPTHQVQPSQPQLPQLAHVKFVQRDVVSTDQNAPYAIQVIIQTDETIASPYFAIVCDSKVEKGDFFVTGQGVMMNVMFGTSKDGRAFIFKFGFPAFTPDSPIVVTIRSKAPIRAIGLQDLRGT
jgi:hypothetical protein